MNQSVKKIQAEEMVSEHSVITARGRTGIGHETARIIMQYFYQSQTPPTFNLSANNKYTEVQQFRLEVVNIFLTTYNKVNK